ncbi:hypothetical protein ACIGT4_21500 [Streptomyces sioyaensis]|uniref:hypothetical protein n=1 Tax=Streptomyces sioyaensis TaxID=67364 RepID=UPI0037D01730
MYGWPAVWCRTVSTSGGNSYDSEINESVTVIVGELATRAVRHVPGGISRYA